MKKFTALLCLAGSLFLSLSCEKQTWDETKMFNQNRTVGEHHGAGGHGAEGHAPAAGEHAAPAGGHAAPAGEHAPAAKH